MRYLTTIDGRQLLVEVVRTAPSRFRVRAGERDLDASAVRTGASGLHLVLDTGESLDVDLHWQGEQVSLLLGGETFQLQLQDERRARLGLAGLDSSSAGPQPLLSSMPGKVVRVLVKPGDPVAAGQPLVVVEAMKMENVLPSPKAGRVAEVRVREGQTVEGGARLVVVE